MLNSQVGLNLLFYLFQATAWLEPIYLWVLSSGQPTMLLQPAKIKMFSIFSNDIKKSVRWQPIDWPFVDRLFVAADNSPTGGFLTTRRLNLIDISWIIIIVEMTRLFRLNFTLLSNEQPEDTILIKSVRYTLRLVLTSYFLPFPCNGLIRTLGSFDQCRVVYLQPVKIKMFSMFC